MRDKDRFNTPEDVDSFVSAEIPSHEDTIHHPNIEIQNERRAQRKRLREIVTKNMIHGPCQRNSMCMYLPNGERADKCQKSFPKPFSKDTVWDEELSYPIYKRRSPSDGGENLCEKWRND